MIRPVFPSMFERSIVVLLLIFVVAFGLVLSASPAWGQATAALNGTVRDSAGAVVTDATVVLHNRDTNLDRSAVTNSVGDYVMPDVQPGNYDLRITKNGFGAAVRSGITLLVNQTTTYDFTLRAGSVSQVVQVQANPVALETSTSEVGVAVVKEQVNDLPLNGRNFTQLLNLTPGVSTVNVSQNSATSGGVWSNPIGTFSYPSVNGQTNRSNLFLLDGVNNQGSFGSTYAVPPIVDDIQEFKVQSHNDDASFGGVMGGVVNVVTKSGTSKFHGSGWEFLRNRAFDADIVYPLLPAAEQSASANQPDFQQNQFGVTFGGPLPIPGEHAQKTFFFLSYEGFRLHTAASNQYITPNTPALAAVAAGGNADFSSIVNQIYNPYNGGAPFLCSAPGLPEPGPVQAPGGTPCNIIPASMLDQTMVKYAQTLFPTPNITPSSPTSFNGLDTTKTITRQDEGSGRLDHQFSQHDTVWARYSSFRQPVTGSGGFAGLLHDQVSSGYNVAADYIHLFSGSMLAEFHFGRNNMNIDQGSQFAKEGGGFGTALFNPNFAGGFKNSVSMVPEVYIQGYIGTSNPSAHGSAQIDDTHASDIWEYGGDFTKTIGRHTFKAGADFASNNVNALYLNSSVEFLTANTANPNPAPNAPASGDGLASFLLGIPGEASRRNVVETTHAGWVDGFYAMDQWKVTDKLNLNIGLRYDLTLMPIYGNNPNDNYYVGDIDFSNGTYVLAHNAPACSATQGAPCIPGGVLPANVVLTPLGGGRIFHNDFNDIQPRVGFVYQLLSNTVLRAGYGRFFDNWAAITQTAQNYEGTWPSLDQLGASNINLPNAAAPTTTAENPLNQTSGPPVTGPTPFTQSTWFADPYLKRPYADQWNFGVQQQVTSKEVLTVNYVGSVGRRLDIGGAYNVATTPGGNVGCPSSATNPNDFNCGAPFPYIGATAYDRNQGKSSYNALQVSLNGRQQHGLTYLISYTWSKSLDLGCTGWYGVEGCSIQNPYDLQADKGPSATDLPQIFSAAWVYALPFGKGGTFSSGNPVVNAIIGGWNLNGVLSFNSGEAFDVGTGQDLAQTGNYNYGNGYGYERANLVGNPYPSNKTPSEWINNVIGQAFAYPAKDTFGDLGRDSLRSDWYKNLDLSVFRQFPITERFRMEFRFEVFNATNTPVWAIPITDMDLSNFGQVTSTLNHARQLQFGLKLYF
jgi:Carboxypeptidase regulatory-like domain/TonB dependent receptor/TonB-dependent Receptor Plug Domain